MTNGCCPTATSWPTPTPSATPRPSTITRCIYTGVIGNGDDVDVRELRSAGALLDDPEFDGDADGRRLTHAGARASTSTWTTTNTPSGAAAHDSNAAAMSSSSASSLSP